MAGADFKDEDISFVCHHCGEEITAAELFLCTFGPSDTIFAFHRTDSKNCLRGHLQKWSEEVLKKHENAAQGLNESEALLK